MAFSLGTLIKWSLIHLLSYARMYQCFRFLYQVLRPRSSLVFAYCSTSIIICFHMCITTSKKRSVLVLVVKRRLNSEPLNARGFHPSHLYNPIVLACAHHRSFTIVNHNRRP